MRFTRFECLPSLRGEKLICIAALGIVSFLGGRLLFIDSWAYAAGSQWISFASNRTGNFDIYVVDINGKNLRNLTNHPADEFDPTWSPDGRFLAYASNREGNFDIYVMDMKKKEHHQLTHHLKDDLFPAWSPDGKWIAFSSKRAGNPDIYKTNINGTHLVQLTNRGKNGRPAWSPDSQWIAFGTYRGDKSNLYVMTSEGRRIRSLAEAAWLAGCTWSPDGKQIAFGTWERQIKPANVFRANIKDGGINLNNLKGGVGVNLSIIDINGKNLQKLTQIPPWRPKKLLPPPPLPQISFPTWSPDGDWIAYSISDVAAPERSAAIHVINIAGKARGEFLQGAGPPWLNLSPAWVPETFFSVSPSPEKQTTLWGRLKQKVD